MSDKQAYLFGIDNIRNDMKKRHTLILPVDTLVLLIVVIVLLLTLAFSLGIERGRKIAYSQIEKKSNFQQEEIFNTESEKEGIKEKVEETQEVAVIPNKVNDKDNEKKHSASAKYILQLATYLKKETAEIEVTKLEDKGYPVFLSQKGKYVVLFIGDFSDKNEAEEKMAELKKRYKDCFIRQPFKQ